MGSGENPGPILYTAKKSVRPAGLTDFLLINDVAALYA